MYSILMVICIIAIFIIGILINNKMREDKTMEQNMNNSNYGKNDYEQNRIIEKYIKTKLPDPSKKLKFNRNGEHFNAKILLEKNQVEDLKKQLIARFGEEDLLELKEDIKMYNFKSSCEWWDLDNKDIVNLYFGMTMGEPDINGVRAKSVPE